MACLGIQFNLEKCPCRFGSSQSPCQRKHLHHKNKNEAKWIGRKSPTSLIPLILSVIRNESFHSDGYEGHGRYSTCQLAVKKMGASSAACNPPAMAADRFIPDSELKNFLAESYC